MKSLFTSRTVWFNLIAGLTDAVATHQDLIPVKAQPYVALGIMLGNIFFRSITSEPVSLTGK